MAENDPMKMNQNTKVEGHKNQNNELTLERSVELRGTTELGDNSLCLCDYEETLRNASC